eukprot:9354692-Pyramimonas_sp.AAC.1
MPPAFAGHGSCLEGRHLQRPGVGKHIAFGLLDGVGFGPPCDRNVGALASRRFPTRTTPPDVCRDWATSGESESASSGQASRPTRQAAAS